MQFKFKDELLARDRPKRTMFMTLDTNITGNAGAFQAQPNPHLCYQTGTYQKSVAFSRRKDVWTCKWLATEAEHLKLDGQVLRRATECNSKSARRRSMPKKGLPDVRHSWLG